MSATRRTYETQFEYGEPDESYRLSWPFKWPSEEELYEDSQREDSLTRQATSETEKTSWDDLQQTQEAQLTPRPQ